MRLDISTILVKVNLIQRELLYAQYVVDIAKVPTTTVKISSTLNFLVFWIGKDYSLMKI